MTRDLQRQGLIVNPNLEEHDGTTAVVRSRHLPPEELAYCRWRAARIGRSGASGGLTEQPLYMRKPYELF